jgi:hypothetical protein
MFSIKHLLDHIKDLNPEALLVDGYDDCIVGFTQEGKVVYEQTLMISKYMKVNKCPLEEAIEFLEHNTFNAYVGEYTPIYIVLFDSLSLDKILNNQRAFGYWL